MADTTLGLPPNRFVGKNKTRVPRDEQLAHSTLTKPRKESNEALASHLKEFEEWANPAFNVLVVQTPRPAFFEAPILNAFRDTVKETGDLLQSMLRFGLPQTSVRNKLPYWREDNSPLPTTASVPLQKALKVMDMPLAPSHGLHGDGVSTGTGNSHDRSVHGHAHAHGHAGSHRAWEHGKGLHGHVEPQRFLMKEMPSWTILALNMACWWFLTTPAQSGAPSM